MCGRFSLYTPPDEVAHHFRARLGEHGGDQGDQDRPLWNIAPTSPVLGVRVRPQHATDGSTKGDESDRVLDRFRWGLIPSWAKNTSGGSRLIVARAESIMTKSSFRGAFQARRLVIPADGFFEWHKAGRNRQPHYFHRADGSLMAFAGLWEAWRDGRNDGPWVLSCTIVTSRASTDIHGIHDRMPIVLERDQVDAWLDPATEIDELRSLLRPTRPGTLEHHRVGPRVGNVRNDSPDLIAKYEVPSSHS